MATEKTEKGQSVSLADLVEAFKAMQPAQPQGLTAEQLAAILEGNAQSTRKALRPENERHPDISAFNPKGERDHPRPKLKRKVFYSGMELHEDELTVAEIELLNQFDHSRVAKNGQWKADIKPTGELVISFPAATTDDRMALPNGMTLILTELLGGVQAVDPANLAAQVAELQKQLKDMQAPAA